MLVKGHDLRLRVCSCILHPLLHARNRSWRTGYPPAMGPGPRTPPTNLWLLTRLLLGDERVTGRSAGCGVRRPHCDPSNHQPSCDVMTWRHFFLSSGTPPAPQQNRSVSSVVEFWVKVLYRFHTSVSVLHLYFLFKILDAIRIAHTLFPSSEGMESENYIVDFCAETLEFVRGQQKGLVSVVHPCGLGGVHWRRKMEHFHFSMRSSRLGSSASPTPLTASL